MTINPLLLCWIFVAVICDATDNIWTKLEPSNFPTDAPILTKQALDEMTCAIKASEHEQINAFCHDGKTNECFLYRTLVGRLDYNCNDTCQLDLIICHQKNIPSFYFVMGLGAISIPPGKRFGIIRAKNIFNSPMTQSWNLTLPPGEFLELNIKDFDLGPCGCSCASLEVRNGNTKEIIDGNVLCGNNKITPFKIIVRGPKVELFLTTDGSAVLDGFELEFETYEAFLCDPEIVDITNETGIIEVSNVLPTSMTCIWRFRMPVGKVIRFTFSSFELGSCCCASVEFWDTAVNFMPLTGISHCGSTVPFDIKATVSESVDVYFQTSGSSSIPGFTFEYEAFDAPPLSLCSTSAALTDPEGFITVTSTVPYLSNTNCNWKISVASGSKVGFFMIWMDTELDYDFVTITDLASNQDIEGGPLSGILQLPPMTATDNLLEIIFTSDHIFEEKGFFLYYYTV